MVVNNFLSEQLFTVINLNTVYTVAQETDIYMVTVRNIDDRQLEWVPMLPLVAVVDKSD